MEEKYDVVVVGGGAAGLSGALTLGRARRSVLVVDAGAPRNAPAGHVHNYLGREGTPPGELLAVGRAEVTGYGGEIVTGTVTSVHRLEGDDGFRVLLADGRQVRARRLLVTTGLVDELPDVPGLAERWGRDVLHCPYCHGWEVRDQAIGVLADSPMAAHQALLFRQWSERVTLFLHTAAKPTDEEYEQLAARGVTLVEGEVAALETTGDRLDGVRMRSGELVPCQAVVVAPRFTARADVLASLGLEPVPQLVGGHVVGSYVPADPTGATAVPGVWVAGNVADLRAQVIVSAASALNTAAAINADLIAEDTRHAVAAHRRRPESLSGHAERVPDDRHGPATAAAPDAHRHTDQDALVEGMFSEQAWEERYRSRDAVWSGRPNPQLVAETADLPPGTALDVGCGEGADALWLAERGWRVTAADFATVALRRGAEHAEALGAEVAGRIDWVHADLTGWAPDEGRFDLVTAHFMHLPKEQREALHTRLAAAVAPGGTLLIVGHHFSDLETTMPRLNVPEMFFTAEEVAHSLDPDLWDILVTDTRPRLADDPEGRQVTIHDAILRARRRP
ncbi:bifunctional NAD(P)/FAD-dependent oxidoreductase/class I SAM-dependent methyltransferase [Streptosporangium amethystogenes subsp. fukuiense]|uniref:Bifunctional NAD(P)/FAD-dependent oxidoreductase/class I SAM-dependent methyltransferase n=1 Tax=Streptosporangium amethystogenes subsp. fukuiense TaxID=698418 RepID=A0ABW2T3J6_9ACTN